MGQWDWLVDLLLDPIRQGILGDVARWVSGPLERLLEPLRAVGNTIRDLRQGVSSIAGQIVGPILSPIATIGQRIASTPGQLLGGLVSPLATIGHRIASVPGQLVGPIVSPLATIGHRIASAPSQVVGPLMSPLVTIGARLASNPNQLLAGLLSPLATIGHHLASNPNQLAAFLSAPLMSIGAQAGGIQAALQGLSVGLGTVGFSLLATDKADRQALVDRYWSRFLGLGGSLQDAVSGSIRGNVAPFLGRMLAVATELGTRGLTELQGFVLGPGQIKPEDAPAVGTRAFLAASGLGATAHLVSTAVELVHPLRMMGFHYLSGFLADMGSFTSISNALIGTMANVGIAQPMRWLVNARTRTNLPTMGDLQAMHRKHTLSASEFAKYSAYWGLDDMWIERFIEYLPADPRLFDILRMAETGIPETAPPAEVISRLQRMGIRAGGNPDWWLELKFALAGYDWIDIPKLVDTVHARLTSTERQRLVTTASTNFRAGYMNEADYRRELADAGLIGAQIEWKIRAERLAALNDDIDDLVALFVDQFLKDVLTFDELRVALVNVGVTPTKTEILARRAAIRKMPKPVDDTAKVEEKATREMQVAFSRMYQEQYRADMITADQYYASLRAIGIREAVAWATVEIEVARRIGQVKRTELQAQAQAITRTQAAQQRLYREQFRAGQIDAGTYYNDLVMAGVLPAEARAIVDAEVVLLQAARAAAADSLARAEVTRTTAALERLYRDQFRAYQIDDRQYDAHLLELGISAERARATVQAEVTARLAALADIEAREAEATQRAAQRAQAAVLREKYDAGLVDADQYLAGLLQIAVDPDLARATVELAEVQRFDLLNRQALKDQERAELELQRKQADLYTRRYRAGELTDREYYDNLVAIGIPELLAATTAELEADQRLAEAAAVREALVIPAIKRAWDLFVKDAEARYKAGELTLDQYVAELVFSGLDVDVAQIIAAAEQRIRSF